jgi:poly-beta-1,6-N-acetyl-D-glucosamine synthase
LEIIVSIVFILYLLVVLWLFAGWRQTAQQTLTQSTYQPLVTVIIPVRNEESTITEVLKSVARQTYRTIEVLIVNDHSEDNTVARVNDFLKNYKQAISIRLIDSIQGHGKKTAITTGVHQARGEIIITTDADCRVSDQWVASIVARFDKATHLIAGPVVLQGDTFFGRLQRIEFISLVASGAATLGWKIPTMANGANLAFRRQSFEEVKGFEGNLHIPSGDDEFLLQKIAARYPGGIRFTTNKESVVTTSPAKTVRMFIQQRIRWAGKWRARKHLFTNALAVSIFLCQTVFLALPWCWLADWVAGEVVLAGFAAKILMEWIFLRVVAIRWGTSFSVADFLVCQLLYPYYVVGIALLSGGKAFSWKGRKY